MCSSEFLVPGVGLVQVASFHFSSAKLGGHWSLLKVTELCLTLCDPMDYTVRGILQARILEWVAFPFSGESSQPRG